MGLGETLIALDRIGKNKVTTVIDSSLQYIEILFGLALSWLERRIDLNLTNADPHFVTSGKLNGETTTFINLPTASKEFWIWIPDICMPIKN